MVWPPESEKNLKMFIRFDVIPERDGQTDGQTLHDSNDRDYASHRAVKMQLCNVAAAWLSSGILTAVHMLLVLNVFCRISRLLMVAVCSEMGIFEGHPNRRIFTHNIDLLQRQQYRLAGQLVTWSLANGGPGLNCLSKHVCSLMMGLHMKDDLRDAVNDIDVESKDIICQASCRVVRNKLDCFSELITLQRLAVQRCVVCRKFSNFVQKEV